MNFLAHAYLSFGRPQILAGNMISDFVKGKKQYDYDSSIREGIILHRAIDAYTDNHPAVKEMKALFTPIYRLYSSPIADVLLDHLLATDLNIFPTDDSLLDFTTEVYSQLTAQEKSLPENFRQTFYYMKSQNWLYHYRTYDGLQKSLGGLQRRSKYLTDMLPAYSIFREQEKFCRACYESFFPDVKKLVLEKLKS